MISVALGFIPYSNNGIVYRLMLGIVRRLRILVTFLGTLRLELTQLLELLFRNDKIGRT